jgi:hypothetical protein
MIKKFVLAASAFLAVGCTPITHTISGKVVSVGTGGTFCKATYVTFQVGVAGQVHEGYSGAHEALIQPLIGKTVSLHYVHHRAFIFCPATTLTVTEVTE